MRIKFHSAAVLVLLTFIVRSLVAQQDSTYQLQPVDITEKRFVNLPFDATTRNVQFITREQIAQLPVQSVAEALTYVAGVDLRQRGPLGAQVDPGMMGSTFEQILILIDGIPMRDAQTGHNQFNLPIDISQIERIEILKGTASRMYGANALAGAINIVTRAPGKDPLRIQLFGGSPLEQNNVKSTPYGLAGGRISAGFAGSKDNTGHQVDLSYLRTDGYRYNSENTQARAAYRGRMLIGEGTLTLQGGMVINEFGANGFYAFPFDTEAKETVQTTYGAVRFEQKIGQWILRPLAYLRYNHDDYIFIRQDPSVYRNNHFTTAAGAEFHAVKANKAGQFGLGYESRSEIIRSNNLGSHERYFHSFYLEQYFSGSNGKQFVAGAMAQYTAQFGIRVYPGFEFSIPVSTHSRAFGHIGTGSRLPTYTDLYYSDRANSGNASLEPEEAFSGEIGWRYHENNLRLQVSGIYRNTNYFIDYTRTSDADKWIPENFSQVIHTGADFRLNYRFEPKQKTISPLWLQAGYTLLSGEIDNSGKQSKYALSHLRHQLTAQLSLKTTQYLTHSFAIRYNERIDGQQYAISDYRIRYQLKKWAVNGDITNIFNRIYRETGFIEMPGRWYRLSVEFSL
jgi:iron complex outermembrane receptor protein